MKKYSLTIFKKDIKEADFCSSTDCPVARTLKRAGFKDVSVSGHFFNVNDYEGIRGNYPKIGTTIINMQDGKIPITRLKLKFSL